MGWKRDENVKNGNFDEKWVLIWTNLRIAIHLSLVPLSGIENSASKCLGIYFFWHSFCPVNVTNCHNLQLLITSKFLIFEFLIFITRNATDDFYFKGCTVSHQWCFQIHFSENQKEFVQRSHQLNWCVWNKNSRKISKFCFLWFWKKKRNFEKNAKFWIEPKLKFRYVVGAERKQLAKSLSLTETQVNYVIWSGYKMYLNVPKNIRGCE